MKKSQRSIYLVNICNLFNFSTNNRKNLIKSRLMKKVILLIFSIVLITNSVQAQNNTQSNKAISSPKSKSEIDKLYEKYKGVESIVLYTPHGDLNGNISIELNDKELPVSVSVFGNSNNKAAIAEFLSNTIKMKLGQGYVVKDQPFGWGSIPTTELVTLGLGWEILKEHSFQLLMRKGNMYFTANAGYSPVNYLNLALSNQMSFTNDYSWEIETCDTKRQGGSKASNFEF
jgi:hypothetical protein